MRNLIWIILAVSIGLGCAEPPKSEPIIPATNEKPVEPTKPPVVDVKTDQGEVEILQVRLSALGFDTGPIDNDFGPKTKAALKAFQKSKGLPETGLVDLTTWKAL
jgi:peptidoglycan hydrolase-like protein with peptidoglycan-binding domain